MSNRVYIIMHATYSLADNKPASSDYQSVYQCKAYDSHEAASSILKSIKNIKGIEYEYDQEASDVLPYRGHVDWKELDIKEVFYITSYPVCGENEA